MHKLHTIKNFQKSYAKLTPNLDNSGLVRKTKAFGLQNLTNWYSKYNYTLATMNLAQKKCGLWFCQMYGHGQTYLYISNLVRFAYLCK